MMAIMSTPNMDGQLLTAPRFPAYLLRGRGGSGRGGGRGGGGGGRGGVGGQGWGLGVLKGKKNPPWVLKGPYTELSGSIVCGVGE